MNITKEDLDRQVFYEACQDYRNVPKQDLDLVHESFEELKLCIVKIVNEKKDLTDIIAICFFVFLGIPLIIMMWALVIEIFTKGGI